jgi:CheY-like chemotaxis protein
MLKMLMRLIGEDINLVWMPGSGLWPINMDPSQIDQVMVNLCVNTRDAISGIGKLIIETENAYLDETYCAFHPGFVPGEYVKLAVSDNGSGMSKEVIEHVFEPFFTTKELGKGTGLGLSTVYGIVKQNKGFIDVYSELNKGTTFKIYLPRFEGESFNTSEENMGQLFRGGGETLLLVEDDLMILHMIRNILEELGYVVLTARTPNEALLKAEKHASEIQLLITDVIMPEMNGRDLAKLVSDLMPGLKYLFMSGYTANVIAHHSILDKGVNFIQKPFSMQSLSEKVHKVLNL